MADMIWLEGVACRVKVGVSSPERSRRQKITVDVGLETDCSAAAERDDFGCAVDYEAVEDLIRVSAEAGARALVETLAERLAAAVLKAQPRVSAVVVRVRKTPFVTAETRGVSIEIRRLRES